MYLDQPLLSSDVSVDSCSVKSCLFTLVVFAGIAFAEESKSIIFALGLRAEYSTLPKLQKNKIVKTAISPFLI